MSQKLELYSDDKMLIRTTSPDTLIDIDSGKYQLTTEIYLQLTKVWSLEKMVDYVAEYGFDNLILEVING